MIMDNEVRLAFDEVILCNYESRALLFIESTTEYLDNIYRLHRSIGANLLKELDYDHFETELPEKYMDFLSMISGFMYWWSDLD